MNAIAAPREVLPEAQEAATLARELSTAYRSLVEVHKKQLGLSTQEAVAGVEAPCPAEYLEAILHGPPDEVNWYGMEQLVRHDPELAARRWDEMKREALDELRSGHRAAQTLEAGHGGPWP